MTMKMRALAALCVLVSLHGARAANLDITHVPSGTIQPSQIQLGSGVGTALGVGVGSPGAPVLFNGAGGTPSSINLGNATNLPNSALQTGAAAANLGFTPLAPGALPSAPASQLYGGTGAAGAAQEFQMTGNSVLLNASAASGPPAPFTMPNCSAAIDALIWTTNSGFGCNTLTTGGYYWLGAQTGVACNGTQDDTSYLQAAWTAAAAAHEDLWIGGVGTGVCKFSSITAPTPTSGNIGNRASIAGPGEGVVELNSTVTGSNCAIILSATYGTNGSYNDTFRGFSLLGTAYGGNGICLTNITHASFEHIWIGIFNIGVYAKDSIDISWIEDTWDGFTDAAVDAIYGSNSYPNAWTFIDPHVFFATNYGLIFQNPTDLNIVGGDWENNNISGTAGDASIYINGNPLNGSKGLTLTGGYFSANAGSADIFIADGGAAISGVHTINGAEFDRPSNTQYVAYNVFINNAGTGTTILNIHGNGFAGFNSYVPSASRPYVTELTPGGTNYVINSGGNYFQSAIETPSGPWWEETGWYSYTPSVTCGSGSLTAYTATGSYKRLTRKTIAVQTVATITTIGTCASYLIETLPTTANSLELGAIRNTTNNVSGSMSTAVGSNAATLLTATGTIPPTGSGQVIEGSLTYESQ